MINHSLDFGGRGEEIASQNPVQVRHRNRWKEVNGESCLVSPKGNTLMSCTHLLKAVHPVCYAPSFTFAHTTSSKAGSLLLLVFTNSNALTGRSSEKAFNECVRVSNVFHLCRVSLVVWHLVCHTATQRGYSKKANRLLNKITIRNTILSTCTHWLGVHSAPNAQKWLLHLKLLFKIR